MNNDHRFVTQRGIALVLVLVFLVVLTLLGTTAMRTARIEEQLAGTTFDRLVARSAGDAAIADAGDYLLWDTGPAKYNAATGAETNDGWSILAWRQNSTDWRDSAVDGSGKAVGFGNWGGTLSSSTALNPTPAFKNPTFIVDQWPRLTLQLLNATDPPLQTWRVTARGAGGRATTEVYSEIMLAIPQ